VAIPICRIVLPQATKQGNSNTAQRKKLMKRLLNLLPAEEIKVLTMDREFNGKVWLKWVDNKGVKYVLRIKGNVLINGKYASTYKHGKQLRSKRSVNVWDGSLLFSGCKITGKNTRDSYLYVVSNYYFGKEALALYKQRWGIELLFGHFKMKGFDLETTHMDNGKKIEKLFGILTLAFLISYGWGSEMKSTHDLKAYHKRKSIFRLGLDNIARMFTHRNCFKDEIEQLLNWFSGDKYSSIIVVLCEKTIKPYPVQFAYYVSKIQKTIRYTHPNNPPLADLIYSYLLNCYSGMGVTIF